MANRIVLNTISYHGSGAIKEIPGEITRRGFKKVFVCTDPDLVKFGVAAKVTDLLDEAGIAWSMYSEIKPNPTIKNVHETGIFNRHRSWRCHRCRCIDRLCVQADLPQVQ